MNTRSRRVAALICSCTSLFALLSQRVDAVVNESVTLRPAPAIIENISGIAQGSANITPGTGNDVVINQSGEFVFGKISEGSSDAGTTSSYTPPSLLQIDPASIVITSIADLQATLDDETTPPEFRSHLGMMSSMNDCLTAADVLDYVPGGALRSVISPLSPYVSDGTVSEADLRLSNLFDIYFPRCEELNGANVMITFDASSITTGIYALVQYDGTAWSVLPAQNIMDAGDGLITVTFDRITPVALLSISQWQIDNALNPPEPQEEPLPREPEIRYMGAPATGAIIGMGGFIVAEAVAAMVVYNWRSVKDAFRRRLRGAVQLKIFSFTGLSFCYSMSIAPASIVILLAECAVAVLLAVMIIRQIRYNIRASRKERQPDALQDLVAAGQVRDGRTK